MRHATALGLSLLLAGCAFGDGRGFATVDGTLTVELREDTFTTASGAQGTLSSVAIGLVSLELSGDTRSEAGIETRVATLPVPGEFDPVVQTTSAPFGPYEADRGDYTDLTAVVGRLVVEGMVGVESFRIEIAPERGVRVSAGAELLVNRDKAPLITIVARLILPDDLMDGLDPTADDIAETIQAKIEANGVIDASWNRKAD